MVCQRLYIDDDDLILVICRNNCSHLHVCLLSWEPCAGPHSEPEAMLLSAIACLRLSRGGMELTHGLPKVIYW